MHQKIKPLINQIKAHLIKLKMPLNSCGCAARIGCVERKLFLSEFEGTIDETSSATIKRNTQPSDLVSD